MFYKYIYIYNIYIYVYIIYIYIHIYHIIVPRPVHALSPLRGRGGDRVRYEGQEGGESGGGRRGRGAGSERGKNWVVKDVFLNCPNYFPYFNFMLIIDARFKSDPVSWRTTLSAADSGYRGRFY